MNPLPPETLDMLPFGVLSVTSDLTIAFANRWLISQMDASPESVQGKMLTDVFPEINEAQKLYAFRLVLESAQPVVLSAALHGYLIRLGGGLQTELEYMPQEVHLLPVFGTSGDVDGVLVLIYDRSKAVTQQRLLKNEIRRTRLLQKIDRAMAALQLDDCLRIIVEGMQELLAADSAAVFLRRKGRLETAICAGDCRFAENTSFAAAGGASAWVARTGVPLLLDKPRRELQYRMLGENSRSFLGVPLVFQGRVKGVLAVESRLPAAFTADSLETLEMLSSRAAVAIQNAILYDEEQKRRSYFQTILNQSSDIIVSLDTDLRITMVNAGWDAFAWKSGASEWIGHKAVQRSVLDVFPREHRARWKAILHEVLSGKVESQSEELYWPIGEHEYWLNVRVAPLHRRDGTVIGVVASARDITDIIQTSRQLERVNQQLSTLVEAMQILNAQLSVRALLDASVNFLYRIFDAAGAAFYAWDAERSDFVLRSARGLSEVYYSIRLPSLETLPEEHIRHFGVTAYLADVRLWSAGLRQEETRGVLLGRVFSRHVLAGLLAVYFDHHRLPTPEERELLESFSTQFGVALENAHAFAEQQELALTDALTGLANRRQFNEHLLDAVERAARYHESATLVMVDIDDFKSFNDTFGHPAGDELLKALAIIMRSNLRRLDLLTRYGGEEFAIILPKTDLHDGYNVAERLRASVERQMPPILADLCGEAAPDKPPRETLTLSLGVASTPRHTLDPETLLSCADIALYEAKKRGKNQVVPYWGTSELRDPASRRLPPPPDKPDAEEGQHPS